MKFIQTNYLATNTIVNPSNIRIYSTTCEDKHFIDIIETNKESLIGEYIISNRLYVLVENEYIEDAKNFYASISLHEEHRGNDVSYYPCVVTCESLSDSERYLKHLIEQVIEHLSSDNSYFSFDKQHKDNIRILGNEQKIIAQILTMCDIS